MDNAQGQPQDGQENTGDCQLLGPFAVIVQAALGLLALLALVYKRWRERPQRPLKIWAFDASKQVFGSALLHLANLFMSMFSAGQIQASVANAAANAVGVAAGEDFQPNPCSFYLLNLAIDTTIGIPILIVLLRLLHAGASFTPIARPLESIQSGNYGQPPRATWWLKQSIIYFLGLLCMKTCVFFIFQLCPWIIVVGDWALRWTEGNEAIQIAFVMLIFPLIMNALQYYIIDSFIKNNKPTSENDNEEGDESRGEEDGLLAPDGERSGEETGEAEIRVKDGVEVRTSETKPRAARTKSYDPDKDGEMQTPAGESSSSASNMEDEHSTRHAS